MKRCFLLAIITGMICFHLFAEETALQVGGKASALPPAILNVYSDKWFDFMNKNTFLLLDGSHLDYEAMKSRLLAVPGNEKYLRRARAWETAGWAACFVGIGSLAAWATVSLVPDFSNKDIWEVATLTGAFLPLFTSAVSMEARNINKGLAFRNYNLSVMGIPLSIH